MSYSPGQFILDNSYRIERELGRGAFGVVYLATHRTLNVPRAVKVLHHDGDGVGSTVMGDYRSRFLLEAKLAAQLTHPHVIQVHDFVEWQDALHCIMEYAPGGSLADLLAKGPLPIERVVTLLEQCCLGLEAIHDKLDAVHRDVKPANLLLDAEGHVKVADLGLAQVGGLGLSRRSQLGSIAIDHPGTPDYTSPEHKDGSEPLAPTADVYALGCVAFELLTGMRWKAARRKARKPSDLRAEVPAWLDAVVVRMVCQEPGLEMDDADDPAKRYVDCAGVREALSATARAEAATRALAAAEARRAEEARIAEEARQAEAARRAEVTRLAEEERKAEEARQAQTTRIAEAARRAEEERKANEARMAEEAHRSTEPVWKQIGIDLVTIPAGEFLFGENKQRVSLDEYRIGRTPVTNAQYKAFVDATGQRVPDHWEQGRIPPQKEKHPVVNVSWQDAVNFCEWAGLRLPTEQEWEKAARGTDGRTYPWGGASPTADLCNFDSNIGTTTAVGRYEKGASPYGLVDMAGNVWEWCADGYDEYTPNQALRGGAYVDVAVCVRCAARDWGHPDNRGDDGGFRVAAPGH